MWLALLLLIGSAFVSPTHAENVRDDIINLLSSPMAEAVMNTNFLITELNVQSSQYRWQGFMQAYGTMLDNKIFSDGGSVKAGIVNVALFLAQTMHETIRYDACDENNFSRSDSGDGRDYPISAACGQLGQDYTQYTCQFPEGVNSRDVQCPVNPNMEVQATTSAGWTGAPPPLFCAPRSKTGGGTPRWGSMGTVCTGGTPVNFIPTPEFPDPYLQEALQDGTDELKCNAYPGHFQGAFTMDSCDPAVGCPNADTVSTPGGSIHYDVEGCCWWGRGVIQVTGPCNIGRLNYHLTGTYYEDGIVRKESGAYPYSDMNLCEDPGLICSGPPEFKWLSGLFFWLFDIQTYSNTELYQFDFQEALQTDGESIFDNPASGRSFVDSVSGLVNRGCPAASCPGAGPVDGRDARYENFIVAMDALRHIYDPSTFPPPQKQGAPYVGPWYSQAQLCAPCEGQDVCALKWSPGGPASCPSWAVGTPDCQINDAAASTSCSLAITPQPTSSPTPGGTNSKNPTSSPTPGETSSKNPTSSPTPGESTSNSPSGSPTPGPDEPPATLTLRDFGATPERKHFPLQRCQGDCDEDADCADDLVCWQRGRLQPVPGCEGNLSSRTDFCVIDPKHTAAPVAMPPTQGGTRGPTKAPSPSHVRLRLRDFGGTPDRKHFPLQRCEGDCDHDRDCDEGLKCSQRDKGDDVPGCFGDLTARTDFCIFKNMEDNY
eukprot:CAMPEP_0119571434 /NCGR_PEP_ID=MMETSP1352-20130426/44115_1 /TAXON_ID=265584 /ORGANISM="Stauroneis constricta, Strain CCMP1120" /LENGTH=713 /DNA_ID=CAMNT_0007621113 /DNA_START=60 /DNA_END=2201 /DNA_ORIENTATION=+